ncbi:MAG: hypothetical protein Q4E32_11130, partial [Bacteroidales bacterium]|nr:hypothetical protein [Bacteroidales bacterium]
MRHIALCFVLLLSFTVWAQDPSTPTSPTKLYIWTDNQYTAYDIPSDPFQMEVDSDGILTLGDNTIDTHHGQIITFDCPRVLAERRDLAYFACIDSIRGQMLFMGGALKQTIVTLQNMDARPRLTYELPDYNTDFTGTLDYIKVLNDGNYFLYEVRPDACDRVWKFWPETHQLIPVFTFRNKYQSLKYHWGLEYVEDTHTLYMAEYGNSMTNPDDPQHPGQKLGSKAGATKIWRSTDNAETWQQFVDFRDDPTIFYEHFHIHAIHYDPYDHRLYVSSGDAVEGRRSNKRLWWTDDNGDSWHSHDWSFYWGTDNNAHSHGQIVSFYADRDFIVAGGDDYHNCIYRIDKSQANTNLPLKPVYYYNPDAQGTVTHYTTRFKKLSNGLIITMLTQGDSNGFPRRTRLVGTYNGYDWFILYQGSVEDGSLPLYQTGNFDEWNGHL